MEDIMISRRRFLQSSLTVALVPLLPRVALSTDLRIRQNWDAFCTGPHYASLCKAVSLMRSNKNSSDPASWSYWPTVHGNFCPHGLPYFLAWHRGFLYRFEGWLRKVSGDPDLVLPYWNYYQNPQVPPEFLDPTVSLYRTGRTGSDVTGALSLAPFADTIINFQRGLTNAFEPTVESAPHNPVHNLIGGMMGSIKNSPWDPLFWVHHANIDRLWAAWINAGGGRKQPSATNSYWSGDFNYGPAIKAVPRVWTTTTTNYFGYTYDDLTMPSSLPSSPPPTTSTTLASTFSLAGTLPAKPAGIAGPPLGSSQPLALDENSLSVNVPLTAQDASRVRSAMLQPATAAAASGEAGPVRVVLDGVHLTGLGEKGGYFYKVYINLPDGSSASGHERNFLLGMIGPFEIEVAQMKAAMNGKGMQGMQGMHASAGTKGARLVFPATDALRSIWPTNLDQLCVSFVRVNGSKRPTKGQTIRVDAFSVEADPVK
jgi:tyrosinase